MRKSLALSVLLAAFLMSGCTYVDAMLHPGNPKVLVHYFDAEGNITRREWKRLCDVTDCGLNGPHKATGGDSAGSSGSTAPARRTPPRKQLR